MSENDPKPGQPALEPAKPALEPAKPARAALLVLVALLLAIGLGSMFWLDARLACSPPIQESLRAALFRHQVLAIRDQALTPEQFVAFARNFGELEPFFTNAYSLPFTSVGTVAIS